MTTIRSVGPLLISTLIALSASTARGDVLPIIPVSHSVSIPFSGVGTIAGAQDGFVVSANVLTNPTGQVVIVDGDTQSGPWVLTDLPAPQPFTLWGRGLARSGARVVVGAPIATVRGATVGTVTTFARTRAGAWTTEGVLAGSANELFGWALALDGDTLVVASPGAIVNGIAAAGAVRIFAQARSGWQLTQTLTSDQPQASESFGASVALHGDVLAVGGTGSSRSGQQSSGAAWLFERRAVGPFTLTLVVTSPSPQYGDLLGTSVDARDGIIAAGAPGADVPTLDSGAAVVAVRDAQGNWNTTLLSPENAALAKSIGYGVLVESDRVIASGSNLTNGAVTVGFRRIEGVWSLEFSSPIRGPICRYASSMAGERTDASSKVGIVSAFIDCDDDGTQDNVAIANGIVIDCNNNLVPDACEIASNPSLDLDGDGAIDACPKSRAAIELPTVHGSITFKLEAKVAFAGTHAVVVPAFFDNFQAIDAEWPMHVDFADAPPLVGESIDKWCGYVYPGSTPLAATPTWLAIGGVEVGQIGRLTIFDIAADGSLQQGAEFFDQQSNSFFGGFLAATPSALYASTPGDSNEVFPIRRFLRDDAGAWSESTPLIVDAPAEYFGEALAVSGNILAATDSPSEDPLWTDGRVRVFALGDDGSMKEEASLRVPHASVPGVDFFGAVLQFAADRLVVTGTNSGRIKHLWIYRRLNAASWTLEADFAVTSTSLFAEFYSMSTSGHRIVCGSSGYGIESYRRAANGAWIHDGTIASPVVGWKIGHGIAIDVNGKLVTTAMRTTTFDQFGELWLLDPVTDCNGNGVDDSVEIAAGLADVDLDGIPDECERRGDMDLNGVVNAVDLGIFLGRYGQGPGLGDLDDDGDVDSADLAILLGDWS